MTSRPFSLWLWEQRFSCAVMRKGTVAVLLSCAALSAWGQVANPEQLLQDAVTAHQRGDDALAIRKYRELLRTHPEAVPRIEAMAQESNNADAYLLAGQTRLNMAQYDQARRDADAVQRINPKLVGLATLNGMILEQTADYDGALTALQAALAENANDYNARFYLGAIYYFKRDMAKARVQLMHALELEPSSAQARYELALVERAEGNLAAALHDLEAVVHQIPDWLQPHVELSALYYRLHRPEDGAREKQIVDRMMEALQQRQAEAAH